MSQEKEYTIERIQVLGGLEGVRKRPDLLELAKKIRGRGSALALSKQLKIKYSALKHALEEVRILKFFPNIKKSKANALSRLKTDKELKLFSKKYDINEISPKKLYLLVKKWNQRMQENPFILLSQEQHDLLIGSLLGDASIRQRNKNCCFRVSHSIKQKNYINWKFDLLKDLRVSEFKERKRILNKREINMINLVTKTHPMFNYYRNLFYKNKKKTINKEILDQINPRSLAIWICDDGSYDNRQGYIVLCTNSYSLKEHELMKQFFKKRFGLNPTIGFRDRKYYYLRFKQEDSKKLIQIIKPFIPKSMKYKIGAVQK